MKNRSQGMTLLELMMGITVLGILMALAVPTFRTYTANSSASAATNNLVTALAVARSEALRRSNSTGVCATADGSTCSGAADWATGWLAFVDLDGDGVVSVTDANADGTPDELLQSWPGVESGTTALVEGGPPNVVIYTALGMGVAAVQFGISPYGCTGSNKRSVAVSVAGTARTSKITC